MKKALLILLCCIVSVSVATAQHTSHKKKGAIIKMISEESHLFGNIISGPEVKHTFTFINAGDEPLQIKEVMNKYAYINAEWTKGKILPGKKGVIIEYVNTKKKGGAFTNNLYIRSNAQNRNCALGYKLSVKGNIIRKEDQ